MNILQVCLLLLGGFLASSSAFPTIVKEPKDLEENTNVLDTLYITPTMLQDPKDLANLFSYLVEMREKKALSIVGRDNNFIYLMVADSEAQREAETSEVGEVRQKRSLFKKLGKGLELLGPTGVRHVALTISLFNYLGYLPMRLPGVPYHIDTGSPDYNPYNPYNEFHYKEHNYK